MLGTAAPLKELTNALWSVIIVRPLSTAHGVLKGLVIKAAWHFSMSSYHRYARRQV